MNKMENNDKNITDVEIKFGGLWTPRYLAENLLFPKPISIQSAEVKLNAWAHDIIEINTSAKVQELDKENTRLCSLWAKQEIKIEDLEKELAEQKRHKGYLEDINENLTRELNRYRLSTPNKEQWRSVEDGLPTGFWGDPLQEYYRRFSEQVNILVDTGVVGTGAYNRETKKWFVGDLSKERYQELTNTSVTHWQPLPNGLEKSSK